MDLDSCCDLSDQENFDVRCPLPPRDIEKFFRNVVILNRSVNDRRINALRRQAEKLGALKFRVRSLEMEVKKLRGDALYARDQRMIKRQAEEIKALEYRIKTLLGGK